LLCLGVLLCNSSTRVAFVRHCHCISSTSVSSYSDVFTNIVLDYCTRLWQSVVLLLQNRLIWLFLNSTVFCFGPFTSYCCWCYKHSVGNILCETLFLLVSSLYFVPSVLWCCWLGGRKGIRPVKKLSGGVLACPSWCHYHSLSLASVKSRLVLPFWYRLTWVVPERAVERVCVCVSSLYFEYAICRQQGNDGSKTFCQQNAQVRNWGCQLTAWFHLTVVTRSPRGPLPSKGVEYFDEYVGLSLLTYLRKMDAN